ncbi:tetratricopeptide repeat protein [Mariniblastus fucicola]|uniref:Lipoprotein NlpI n=1 Tax=Mariniblastus fucicola TaxID=980251 RepID=A0A5B9PMC6_9BACT|nr:tetratricopeptide repeat protein [Mariniblastus fucicola]QEG23473.1 lipoprotein NlpI [Mariniblastus fucicola]
MHSDSRNCRPAITMLIAFTLVTALGIGCGPDEQAKKAKARPSAPLSSREIKFPAMAVDGGTVYVAQQPDSSDELSIDQLILRADQELASGNIDEALSLIAKVRDQEDTAIYFKQSVARILFGAGEMDAAVEVYDEILKERPDMKPQLWQRGLALYYAGQFEKGVEQFETHQTYNSQDVENSVWHMLCQSQLSSVEEAREKMIQIDEDTRIPMKQVFEMFAGSGSPEAVFEACSYDPQNPQRNGSIYHGLLYVGLFQEMNGDQEASNETMRKALKCKPLMVGLMAHVAEGHLRARKAYPVDAKED